MLLQTNSYIVPKEKRTEHARLLARFRHTLARLGCDQFECYEQTGTNWSQGETSNRFVQIMRFRDRKHQQQVQAAERSDPMAQALIKEFCELINFPYQQQQGLFAVGFYTGVISLNSPLRQAPPTGAQETTDPEHEAAADEAAASAAQTLEAIEATLPSMSADDAATAGAAEVQNDAAERAENSDPDQLTAEQRA